MLLNRIEAIQSASYILGENVRDDFVNREEKAIAGGNPFFYVYNSENNNVRIDIANKDERIFYKVFVESD